MHLFSAHKTEKNISSVTKNVCKRFKSDDHFKPFGKVN